jgi:hypothetical protein
VCGGWSSVEDEQSKVQIGKAVSIITHLCILPLTAATLVKTLKSPQRSLRCPQSCPHKSQQSHTVSNFLCLHSCAVGPNAEFRPNISIQLLDLDPKVWELLFKVYAILMPPVY